MLKMDPYLNVDPGTMSPYQHGEVYVTDDGVETDLDLGHYERFTGQPTSRKSLGHLRPHLLGRAPEGAPRRLPRHTIQMIPHITDEIKARIRALDEPGVDIILCEIGGTVGDIEGLTFLEAIRQIGLEEGRDNVMVVHMTYLPYIKRGRRGQDQAQPAKRGQAARNRHHSRRPRLPLETPLTDEVRRKLSLFCNVPVHAVIEELDVRHTIYEVPLVLVGTGAR
jgi:CTP synthase